MIRADRAADRLISWTGRRYKILTLLVNNKRCLLLLVTMSVILRTLMTSDLIEVPRA